MSERKWFPVMGGPAIPWALIEPCEAQARANHGQSLERLAQRGGLDPSEAVAVLESRRWCAMHEQEALTRLKGLVDTPQAARIAELEARLEKRTTDWLERGIAIERLEAERDAVRKALHWLTTIPVARFRKSELQWDDSTDPFGIDDPNAVQHDGTPESIEAALLAAHREGEGEGR